MKAEKRTVIRLVCAAIALPLVAILALQLNRAIEKKTYRLDYLTLIRRYAAEYELDPYAVAAIVHCESGNRADVVSSAGAIGLMQLMPDTGEWIAGKLSVADYDVDMLKQPETNIRFGCWYLHFLYERFESNDTVYAAYNAGHNRVKNWLDDNAYSADGATLSDVPYPQTKDYVEKVQRAYDTYKKLYPDAFA